MTPADIHYRRVLMTQARVFKQRGMPFYKTLVMWARRRGRSVPYAIEQNQVQLDLFA